MEVDVSVVVRDVDCTANQQQESEVDDDGAAMTLTVDRDDMELV